jgi:hypothetical protein
VESVPRLARRFPRRPARLAEAYRQAPVPQADATGWRTHGHQGYAWRLAPPQLRLLWCRRTRSASGPKEVFGNARLSGCLVVARDGAYHQAPCASPSGSRHRCRDVQDLAKEFPDAAALTPCVSPVAPGLALARGRRAPRLSEAQCSRNAAARTAQIVAVMDQPAQHVRIRRLQEIFQPPADRRDPWADDRRVPAEHHRAERDRRPTVIARHVRVGAQSDAGAHTRGILMSLLHPRKTRPGNVVGHLHGVLAQLTDHLPQDPFPLLFPAGPP